MANRRIVQLLLIAGSAVIALVLLSGIVGALARSHIAVPQTSWAAVGSVAAAVAAGVGVWTLVALRQDSLDRTRPVVIAEFQKNVLSDATELLVRNIGPSVAKNVRFDFNPPLPTRDDPQARGTAVYYVQRRYSRTVPTFGPGMARHDVYRLGHDDNDDAPDEFALTIDYEDAHGRGYSDRYELSVMTERDTSTANPAGTRPEDLRKRTTVAVEAIARGVGRR